MSNYSSQKSNNLLLVRNKLVVDLPSNVDCYDIEAIESLVFSKLVENKSIKAVIIGMDSVKITDPKDLTRLAEALSAFRLLGKKIGLCGINPGIAAIMIRTGIELPHDATGYDLDHVFENMN